jgi:hypothetical protein
MSLKVHALKLKKLCSKNLIITFQWTSNEKCQQHFIQQMMNFFYNLDTYLGVVYQYLLIMKKMLIFNKHNGFDYC